MKQAITMRAVPGSGKSTFAKQLMEKAKSAGQSAELCSADEYFYKLGNGSYAFDPSKISEAHKYCFKKFIQAVNNGVNLIIVDNTNLSAWEISPYKAYAEAHDYDFSINEVASDPLESLKRQQHGVPEAAHKRMSESFEKEFIPPWWNKQRIVSKTDSSGNPVFEEELKEEAKKESSKKIDKILKLADTFCKITEKLVY
jgi:tRNA uridine 5-carbamoylmethylation protein Kti12